MTKIEQVEQEIKTISIEDEIRGSYLDYAMSVIVGRALPDVRDGLKPVHKRILYAMRELSNDWNKPYKKSARIVGDVIGKYHPHGDTAVYNTIVRMAQDFSMRYMLVDGQGNFGSVDGDAPAAMRYTEIRLSKIAHSLLADLDKDTIDFLPNYDGSEVVPSVLPTRIPNLLVNGSSGIAVGMATNIPPHNLNEVIDACLALLDNPEITIDDLLQYIPGPDFPTAGIINGKAGIVDGYKTGRGKVLVRSKTAIETNEDNGKQAIIVNELPYQVNKAHLLEKIAELVKDKKLEGITAIRDESDKDGMRIFIELRRGENVGVVLNNLFIHTNMQTSFGINMVALVDGQPKTLNLKQLLEEFLRHRRQVVTRRSIFELKQARARAHLLEGLGIALANIDEIVALIKSAKTPALAKEKLLERTWSSGLVQSMLANDGSNLSRPDGLSSAYGLQDNLYRLSEAQAQAILELRLQRLTALEQDKIFTEYKELLQEIQRLLNILQQPELLTQVIREELLAVKEEFGDARRTQIIDNQQDLNREDLITPDNVVVTLSHDGYVKRQSLSEYQAQRRGGKGKTATKVKEEDIVVNLFVAHTHDTLLCFSDKGRVYWLKVYLIPEGSRNSRGRPLINLLALSESEKINAILPITNYDENQHIIFATSSATVKKVALTCFANQRSSGIVAINLSENDYVVGVALTDGNSDIMLFSDEGRVVRFHEKHVRSMGRTATGVRGMRLKEGQVIVSLVVLSKDDREGSILTATTNGYGKRTELDEYSIINRGGQGVISIRVNERNGKVVGAVYVKNNDELMLINNTGVLIRTKVNQVSLVGRNTSGVRLIKLNDSEQLVAIEKIPFEACDEDELATNDENLVLDNQLDDNESDLVLDDEIDSDFTDDNEVDFEE